MSERNTQAARLPELLAPAGSPEALDAAIEGGADAVYLGGVGFNARAGAKNFDAESLRDGILRAHAYGVKVYETLNTQVYDRELTDYLRAAELAYTSGVDALIVADLGGAQLIRKYFPDFELHASTQMSGHSSDMAAELKTLGFSRMVVAREISCDDLYDVCRSAPIEIELFVHGALCVCHSGQCLFSSAVGGRSGNRGECAQPCRLPYRGKNRYPLSLKDLCLAEHVPELIRSGVASLKIEGRMKSPSYVYGVTRIWRRLLDERRAATKSEMRELSALFSRGGFTDGYFTGHIGKNMLGIRSEDDKQISRELTAFGGLCRKVPLDMELTVRAGTPVTLTVTDGKGRRVSVSGEVPQTAENRPTAKEDILPKLTRLGGTPYEARRVEISLEDGLMLPFSLVNALRRAATDELTKTGRSVKDSIQTVPAETAKTIGSCIRAAETENSAAENVGKPGTIEETAQATVNGAEQAAKAPLRSAVCYRPEQLTAKARQYFDRIYLPAEYFADGDFTGDRGVGEKRLPSMPDGVLLPAENSAGNGIAKNRDAVGKRLPFMPDGVLLPPVIFDGERDRVLAWLKRARACGATYALVGNIGHLTLARQAGLLPVGDFRLNICNAASKSVALALGCEDVVLSPELTLPRLRDLSKEGNASAIVYGRIPLMILEKCVGTELGGCERCQSGDTVLTDRIGAEFPVRRTAPHRSLIFNSVPTYMADRSDALTRFGINAWHFLFTTESPAEVDRIIAAYRTGGSPGGNVRRIGQ